MRVVTLKISTLLLEIGSEIEIQLLNSIGKPMVATNGFSINKKITLAADTLELSLLENTKSGAISSYKLTIVSNEAYFYFTVPESQDNISHDMFALLGLGCFKDMFSDSFVKKLNRYFTSQAPYFTNKEQYLINLYEYYSNEIINTTSTIDIAKELDEYLVTITGEE